MIQLDGVSEFLNGITNAINEFQQESVEVLRGISIAAYSWVLADTPQWSGNAVSNWNYSVDTVDTEVTFELKASNQSERAAVGAPRNATSSKFGAPVAQKGDSRAIGISVSRNQGREARLRSLTQQVFISNSAKSLDHKSYIEMLEANPNSFLRPVNEPGHMVALTVAELQGLALLSETQVAYLRSLSLSSAVERIAL